MSEPYVPERVLVTGGSGFIGRQLVEHLAGQGIPVRTLGRRAIVGADHVQADVTTDFSDLAEGCDCIIHLAGLADASASFDQPTDFARANVLGTLNALEAARRNNASFVLASSQRVYRPGIRPISEDGVLAPVDPYGQTKVQAEEWAELYARLYEIPVTILRLFSVYGPGQTAGLASGVVSILLRSAREGQPLRVRARQIRDFVDVRDVVRAFELAVRRRPERPEIYNVGTGRPTSIAELGELVRGITRVTVPIIVDLTPGAESYVADTRHAAADLQFEATIELFDGLVWCSQRVEGGSEG
ncbi:MAG: NAD-dependent epimerase/dehydratase family protein [Chloroflexota bacterium]